MDYILLYCNAFRLYNALGMFERLIINLENTRLVFISGKMVGHIISKDGVVTYPKKIEAIGRMPFHKIKQAMKILLETIDYY
jgi:hypothetical protein